MKELARKDFDPLKVIIKDTGRSVQVVMSNLKVSHSSPIEDYSPLFCSDNFDPLRVSDKPDCSVCGDEGAYHRYKNSSFTIHPECRLALKDCIEEVIRENSDEIVCSSI
jgi:hypothetical protein